MTLFHGNKIKTTLKNGFYCGPQTNLMGNASILAADPHELIGVLILKHTKTILFVIIFSKEPLHTRYVDYEKREILH